MTTLAALVAVVLTTFARHCLACVDAEIERLESLTGRPMAAWRAPTTTTTTAGSL